MKAQRAAAAHTAAAVLACWCSAADAYRPFDGTDAAVAETDEAEIELGSVEFLREGAERTLLAPDLRINYGFIPGWEAALEGKLTHGLTAGIPGTSLVESQALLKGVLREGSLQEKPGPSIATEFGILLPGINDQHGTGAVLNGIVSQRWDWGTVHLNAQIALTREQHADYFLDSIIEGPHDWPVRPVAEIFYESDVSLFRTGSALVGAIWQVRDNVAVDFGLRGARVNGETAGEIRAGVTFAFGVTKGPGHSVRTFQLGAAQESLILPCTEPAAQIAAKCRRKGGQDKQDQVYSIGSAAGMPRSAIGLRLACYSLGMVADALVKSACARPALPTTKFPVADPSERAYIALTGLKQAPRQTVLRPSSAPLAKRGVRDGG